MVIVVAIVGMINEARKFGKITRMASIKMKSMNDIEATMNNSAALACGSYVTLFLPCFLVMVADPMPPRFEGQSTLLFKTSRLSIFVHSRT